MKYHSVFLPDARFCKILKGISKPKKLVVKSQKDIASFFLRFVDVADKSGTSTGASRKSPADEKRMLPKPVKKPLHPVLGESKFDAVHVLECRIRQMAQ